MIAPIRSKRQSRKRVVKRKISSRSRFWVWKRWSLLYRGWLTARWLWMKDRSIWVLTQTLSCTSNYNSNSRFLKNSHPKSWLKVSSSRTRVSSGSVKMRRQMRRIVVGIWIYRRCFWRRKLTQWKWSWAPSALKALPFLPRKMNASNCCKWLCQTQFTCTTWNRINLSLSLSS